MPRSVRAVTALFGALLLAYSLLTPLGEAPDEAAHADLDPPPRHRRAVPELRRAQPGQGGAVRHVRLPPDPGQRVLLAEDAPEPLGAPRLRGLRGRRSRAAPPTRSCSTRRSTTGSRRSRSGPSGFLLPGTGLPPLDREWSLLRLISVADGAAAPAHRLGDGPAHRCGRAGRHRRIARAPRHPAAAAHAARRSRTTSSSTCARRCSPFFLAGVLRGDRSLRTGAVRRPRARRRAADEGVRHGARAVGGRRVRRRVAPPPVAPPGGRRARRGRGSARSSSPGGGGCATSSATGSCRPPRPTAR